MDRGLSAQQSSISPRAPNAIHGWVGMMASAFTYGYAVIYWQLAGHVKFAYRTCTFTTDLASPCLRRTRDDGRLASDRSRPHALTLRLATRPDA